MAGLGAVTSQCAATTFTTSGGDDGGAGASSSGKTEGSKKSSGEKSASDSGASSSDVSGSGGSSGSASASVTGVSVGSVSSATVSTGPANGCPSEAGRYTGTATGAGCMGFGAPETVCITQTECAITAVSTKDAPSDDKLLGTATLRMDGSFKDLPIVAFVEGTQNRTGCSGTWDAASSTLRVDCGGMGFPQSCELTLVKQGPPCEVTGSGGMGGGNGSGGG